MFALKALGNFLLVLIVVVVIVGIVGVISYTHEMAPTWAEIAKQQADLDIAIAKQNAQSDIAQHSAVSMAISAGSWVLVLLLLAGGVVWFVWKPMDERQEAQNRMVDGSFATKTIHHNGRTIVLDPNKSQFGFIAYDKETGEIATDAAVTGPERQLEYANNVQRTRTTAARPVPGRPNRTTAMIDAGVFDEMRRERAAKADAAELLLAKRQPDPIVPPSRQLPAWTAKDAFKANTDTIFALGLTEQNEIVTWDAESTPHVRVHGKTQGSGKTNLIKEIVAGAVLSGAHVIVLDRRGFKDWSAFQPFVELVDNRVSGAFYGTVKRLQEIYRERDGLLGGAGVGNLASLTDAPRRIFLVISEFGSACRDALASGELEHVVPILKNIFAESGATGVHLVIEDQAINRNWPPELRGNAEPITGYLPQDASKAGGYTKAFELERYQFHYDGDRFKTFDMTTDAPALLFDAPILDEKDYLIDVLSFVRSVENNKKTVEMPDFSSAENERTTERTSTDLQRMVWAWRDANPGGEQADLRADFKARGIEITRSWVHTCWHKWPGLMEDEE